MMLEGKVPMNMAAFQSNVGGSPVVT